MVTAFSGFSAFGFFGLKKFSNLRFNPVQWSRTNFSEAHPKLSGFCPLKSYLKAKATWMLITQHSSGQQEKCPTLSSVISSSKNPRETAPRPRTPRSGGGCWRQQCPGGKNSASLVTSWPYIPAPPPVRCVVLGKLLTLFVHLLSRL